MKKTISILSIISIVIAVLSLLLAASFLSIFWKPWCLLISAPEAAVAADPIIPIGTFVYMVGCFIVAVFVCVCIKSSRVIVLEIIAIIFLSVVLPVLASYLSRAQTVAIGQTMGTTAIIVLNTANTVSSFASRLMAVSEALCLVVCGMSISKKVILIKGQSNASV